LAGKGFGLMRVVPKRAGFIFSVDSAAEVGILSLSWLPLENFAAGQRGNQL
jgi:hypothetical protein